MHKALSAAWLIRQNCLETIRLPIMLLYVLLVADVLLAAPVVHRETAQEQEVTFWFELRSEDGNAAKTKFKLGEMILIKAYLENRAAEAFPFHVTDKFYQYRFELSYSERKGVIGYRKDRETLLSIREETAGAGMRLTLDPIPGGCIQELETMSLGERYENLGVGKYLLEIEYKTGKVIEPDEFGRRMLRLRHRVAFEIAH